MQKKNLIHTGNIIATSKEGVKVIKCKNCGYIHQIPLPTSTERNNYYKKQYFQETKPNYNKEYFHNNREFITTGYSEKESFLRKHISSKPLDILDIGSAGGYFLKYFQKQGWKITGVELDKIQCNIAKKELGLDIFCGSLNDFIKVNNEKFSVVSLSFVLEHIVDPYTMLKEISEQLLVPEGIICIEVPNDYNELQKMVYSKINNNWWIDKDHLNYFNLKSLNNLLNRIEFNIINTKVTFPMEFFILMGDDYVSNPKLGKKSHQRRVNFEKNLTFYNKKFKERLYNCFLELGIGRTIITYGKKK